ncbi:hypothetical protein pipiens_008536 [Culex pipiens pipiens]|uniref:Uncharacterized protein n=1 Tax=Culex pipiens pipiens TaxID=38569 RepID=A0ABD1DH12_CULPP
MNELVSIYFHNHRREQDRIAIAVKRNGLLTVKTDLCEIPVKMDVHPGARRLNRDRLLTDGRFILLAFALLLLHSVLLGFHFATPNHPPVLFMLVKLLLLLAPTYPSADSVPTRRLKTSFWLTTLNDYLWLHEGSRRRSSS